MNLIVLVSDQCVAVYTRKRSEMCLSGRVQLGSAQALESLQELLDNYSGSQARLLYDLSVEDYNQQQIPHIHGRDKQFLLRRKLDNLYPNGDYAYAQQVRRLEHGRRDDIYCFSGISDYAFLDEINDCLYQAKIEVAGVYSLPLYIYRVIRPVRHRQRVLVISADCKDSTSYTIRHSFLDHDHLYFSRAGDLSVLQEDKPGEHLSNEISRTWRYLHNRRALGDDEDLQVVLLMPGELAEKVRDDISVSACNISYVDYPTLAKAHGLEDPDRKESIRGLVAWVLSREKSAPSHYHPQRLSHFHWRRFAMRIGTRCCWSLGAVASVLCAVMLYQGFNLRASIDGLLAQRADSQRQLAEAAQRYAYTGPDTAQMRAVLAAFEDLKTGRAPPVDVFEIIGKSFAGGDKLWLTQLEWQQSSRAGSTSPGDGMSMEPSTEGSDSDTNETKYSVKLSGTLRNFSGDYAAANAYVEALAARLRSLDRVAEVTVRKQPLDTGTSLETTGSVAAKPGRDFSVDFVVRT